MNVFVVRHQHPADRCPATDFTAGTGLLNHLSGPSATRHGVRIRGEAVLAAHTLLMIAEADGEDVLRAFLRPFEAVSTAEWTGVPLTEVLDRAGVRAKARDVVFRGADRGEVGGRDGQVHFERSMAVDQLGQAGALLAYAMNGEELPLYHGHPLRLVASGWYAVASMKWLTEIELIGQPFDGFFQVDRYHVDGEPVSLQPVRSLIIEPAAGENGRARRGHDPGRGLVGSGAHRPGRGGHRRCALAAGHAGGSTPPAQLAVVGASGSHSRARHGHDPGQGHRPGRADQPDQPQWNALGYANNAVHELSLAVGAGRLTDLPLR